MKDYKEFSVQSAVGIPRAKLAFVIAVMGLIILSGCSKAHIKEYEAIYWPDPPDPPRYVYEGTLRNSEDLEAFTGSAGFKTALTGAHPRGAMAFQKPYDIVSGGGRIIVTDTHAVEDEAVIGTAALVDRSVAETFGALESVIRGNERTLALTAEQVVAAARHRPGNVEEYRLARIAQWSHNVLQIGK